MDVWVLPNGVRDRRGRPYISQEELRRSFTLYDPEGPPIHYGLYDAAPPTCPSFQSAVQRFAMDGGRSDATVTRADFERRGMFNPPNQRAMMTVLARSPSARAAMDLRYQRDQRAQAHRRA